MPKSTEVGGEGFYVNSEQIFLSGQNGCLVTLNGMPADAENERKDKQISEHSTFGDKFSLVLLRNVTTELLYL